jgi:hypothetical protein
MTMLVAENPLRRYGFGPGALDRGSLQTRPHFEGLVSREASITEFECCCAWFWEVTSSFLYPFASHSNLLQPQGDRKALERGDRRAPKYLEGSSLVVRGALEASQESPRQRWESDSCRSWILGAAHFLRCSALHEFLEVRSSTVHCRCTVYLRYLGTYLTASTYVSLTVPTY